MLNLILAFLGGVVLTAIIAYLSTRKNGDSQLSLWQKIFGNRSLLSVIVGHFFGDKNNAASVIAIILVMTLCFIVAWRQKYEYVNGLLNIVFVVIGYYFSSKRVEDKDAADNPTQSAPDDKSAGTPDVDRS